MPVRKCWDNEQQILYFFTSEHSAQSVRIYTWAVAIPYLPGDRQIVMPFILVVIHIAQNDKMSEGKLCNRWKWRNNIHNFLLNWSELGGGNRVNLPQNVWEIAGGVILLQPSSLFYHFFLRIINHIKYRSRASKACNAIIERSHVIWKSRATVIHCIKQKTLNCCGIIIKLM